LEKSEAFVDDYPITNIDDSHVESDYQATTFGQVNTEIKATIGGIKREAIRCATLVRDWHRITKKFAISVAISDSVFRSTWYVFHLRREKVKNSYGILWHRKFPDVCRHDCVNNLVINT
jgi:hypothetical protein